jgi:hypothetical protein
MNMLDIKKKLYEGEHSTYCVEMEQDIWTTSKHDTFENPRNRKMCKDKWNYINRE